MCCTRARNRITFKCDCRKYYCILSFRTIQSHATLNAFLFVRVVVVVVEALSIAMVRFSFGRTLLCLRHFQRCVHFVKIVYEYSYIWSIRVWKRHVVWCPDIGWLGIVHRSYRRIAIDVANKDYYRSHVVHSIDSLCCPYLRNSYLHWHFRHCHSCTCYQCSWVASVDTVNYGRIQVLQLKRQMPGHTTAPQTHRQYYSRPAHLLCSIASLSRLSIDLLDFSTICHTTFVFHPFLVAQVWPVIFCHATVSPLALQYHTLDG